MARWNGTLLRQGQEINDTYRVVRFVGRGAFGEVYRVTHRVFGNQAMKVFTSDFVESSDLSAWADEAVILARLTHENIVRVFEANTLESDGQRRPFMTMEFVSGESLAQLLKREIRLDVPTALSIQLAVLKGLTETHRQTPPVVHRDISPDNILLSYDRSLPRALLSDYGLAQSVDQLSHISGAAGKFLYMAPECFWGAHLPSSDVFSSGVVFYRMLTGVFPWSYDFDELEQASVDRRVSIICRGQKETPCTPSVLAEHCPKGLGALVLKSIATNVEDRYRHAGEFLQDLSAFHHDHPQLRPVTHASL
jgi:serine/threonine protein kinase